MWEITCRCAPRQIMHATEIESARQSSVEVWLCVLILCVAIADSRAPRSSVRVVCGGLEKRKEISRRSSVAFSTKKISLGSGHQKSRPQTLLSRLSRAESM